MKKLIVFIILLVCACAQSQSEYVKKSVHPEMTLAETSNFTYVFQSEYMGYKLLCLSEGAFDQCVPLIFDPNGKIAKVIPEWEYHWVYKESEREKYLSRFVSKKMGTNDYSHIAEHSPLLAKKMAEYDSMNEQYRELRFAYNKLANQWDTSYKNYKKTEDQFLKSLSIEQLELYAKFEDASKEDKAALKELYSRKVQNSLTAEQKKVLTELNDLGSKLEILNNRLVKKKESLDMAKVALDKSNKEYGDMLYAESAKSHSAQTYQSSSMQTSQPSSMQVLADGLSEMAENIRRRSYQQQQQYQMYQINSSLQDISRAIRGF